MLQELLLLKCHSPKRLNSKTIILKNKFPSDWKETFTIILGCIIRKLVIVSHRNHFNDNDIIIDRNNKTLSLTFLIIITNI